MVFPLALCNLQRISITSTCFAFQAIYLSGDRSVYDSIVNFDLESTSVSSKSSENKILAQSIFEALLLADWREEDLFQVPLLLQTLLIVDDKRVILSEDALAKDERKSFKVL